MPTIADVRKKYPQYDDMSDERLADGFHKKFYSDIPREDFLAKLGVVAPARVGPEETNELAEPPTTEKHAAVAKGIEQGATFNFGDEIDASNAAAGAMGLPAVDGGVGKLIRPAVGLIGSYFSDDAAKAYEAEHAAKQSEIETLSTEHPGAFMGGQVAGGVATAPFTPAARIVQGAGWAGRAINAGATGAGYGAAYGAGAGTDAESRIEQGATGALVGGLTGGAASPVVDIAAAGVRGLKNLASPILGALNPEKEAARRVVGALEADAGSGAAERAARLVQEAGDAGIPLNVADTGGDMTRALARSSANTSPAGREALQSSVAERFENQASRFGDFVQEITGASGDTAALQQRVANVGRTVNKAAYSKAFKEGDAGAWDDELELLAQAPSVQSAIRKATRTGANKAVLEGTEAQPNPFSFSEGRMNLREGAIPTLRFWDSVKRNLDDEIGQYQRTGAKSAAADTLALKNALVEKMDGMFPSYRDARRGASAFFDAEDALEAGTKFVNSPLANPEAGRVFSAMSAPEKELFRQGYANELLRRVNAMGDSKNVAADSMIKSARGRERLDMVFGKIAARRVESLVEIEKAMNLTKTAVQGNSSTVRQLVEAGLAGGGAGFGLGYASGDTGYGALGGAILAMGMRRGYNLIDGKVAERVGRLLASDNPNEVRKAVNMISRNPRLLAALRASQEYIGRIVASGGSGENLVPSMISGRAENEQQPENGM